MERNARVPSSTWQTSVMNGMTTVLDQAADEKLSILIIDDEPAVGDALKLVFESNGYEVVLVDKGRAGIDQAARKHFSIGIVDLFLSDISGLQVIKTIREQLPEIILILITGTGTPHDFSVATQLGVSGILIKPFRPDDILRLINRSLAR